MSSAPHLLYDAILIFGFVLPDQIAMFYVDDPWAHVRGEEHGTHEANPEAQASMPKVGFNSEIDVFEFDFSLPKIFHVHACVFVRARARVCLCEKDPAR